MKDRILTYTKPDRIRKRNEFQELYQTGRRFSTRYYQIFYKTNPSIKLGISIPGRLGNAVFRNYQKRVLRAFFRKEIKPRVSDLRLLFVLRRKPESAADHHEDLGKVLEWLLKKNTASSAK